jgi:phospholipase/carboxylesterase
MTLSPEELPARNGPKPRTSATNPHMQLDQSASADLVAQLAERAFSLSGVRERPSLISVPGARALWLDETEPVGPPEAFLIGREFAHIHPLPDGSLHMSLPAEWVTEAVDKGWAEPHPLARSGYIPANVVMVYGPRDQAELDVVMLLLRSSHEGARAR